MRVHGKPTNSPPLRCNFLIPQPWYKIGIEFLQLLFGFQLVWTTGQQHVAVPGLIQPETVAGLVAWKRTPEFAMLHLIRKIINKYQKELDRETETQSLRVSGVVHRPFKPMHIGPATTK